MTRTSGSGTMKLAAAVEVVALALEELVEEVPRQHQVVVGVHLARLLLADDRDPGPDRLRAPLVGVAVGGVRDQRLVELGVLEDRVALGRGAVDVDRLAVGDESTRTGSRELVARRARRCARTPRRARASRAPSRTRATRSSWRRSARPPARPRAVPGVGDEQPDRAAVDVVELGRRRPRGRPRRAAARGRPASSTRGARGRSRRRRSAASISGQVVQLHHPDAVLGEAVGDVAHERRAGPRGRRTSRCW